MPVPWIAVGIGIAGGYALDRIFGDGEYSAGEAFFDGATGALGGGLLRPVGTMLGRGSRVMASHFDDAAKFTISTVDDAVGAALAVSSGQIRPIGIGQLGGYLGDRYTQHMLGKSSGSSSEQNGTHVGPDGKVLALGAAYIGSRLVGEAQNRIRGKSYKTTRFGSCAVGYTKRKVKGRWMCVRDAFWA